MTNIIPTLEYRNAPKMIDWLVRAFGFEKHAVYADATSCTTRSSSSAGA